MTDTTNGVARPAPASDLYRAVWRWHFYAGLLVLPFLIALSLTGAAYLFHDEIDNWIHADLKRVETVGDGALAPSAILAAALGAQPGEAVKYTDPPRDDLSAEVTVRTGDGSNIAVHVDQYSGRVLGSLPDQGTVAWTIRRLHSLKILGQSPRMIIEMAAGWSVLLVATGIWLWWPRGQRGGVVSVRATPARRVFWRDLHAVTGIFVGGFIVFLAVTGLPWSSGLGGKVNQWANGTNFGYPSGVRVDVPMSGAYLDHVAKTSWTLEQAQIPRSPMPGHEGHGPAQGHEAHGQQIPIPDARPIGIDEAVAILDGLGLHRGYAVNLPAGPEGVFSGSVYPADLARQRVVHLDQYTGQPLIDVSYADYGPMGRALEWGINTHMGQTFGTANQIVLLAACLATVLLSVSAAVMWWKRRPAGRLGVPPMPLDRRVFVGLFVLLGIGGVVFPLTGISLAAMIALDLAWQAVARRRALPG